MYRSTGIGFKKICLSIVFTILKKSYFWNIQPVPAPHVSRTKKFHQPSKDSVVDLYLLKNPALKFSSSLFGRRRVLLRFSAQLTGKSYYSTSWYVYSVLKKVPEYRCPLYRSTGIGFLKVIFEYSFHYTQEKLFLRHTTRASPARVTDKIIHQPSKDISWWIWIWSNTRP
jgi:hypothetical protein